jgi:hypothetical protein
MEISSVNNQEVEITSVYFKNKPGRGSRLESYPKRMVYKGREYMFMEGGWRYLIHKGRSLIKLFDVSDGMVIYRLRVDEANRWTLVEMKANT